MKRACDSRFSYLLCAWLMTSCLAGTLYGEVTINRSDAVIEHKTFNPKNPPAEMPKLSGNEAAVTQSFFGADSKVGGTMVDSFPTSEGYEASVRVDTVQMTLRMRVTVWLPSNSNEKIRKHEEGHRKISEHFYADAAQIARSKAEPLMGQIITGTGSSPEKAVSDALRKAANRLGHEYLGATDTPCGEAQKRYDQITEHGTNAVNEDRAMKQAIEAASEGR